MAEEVFENLDEGDYILFNDRKKPLEVISVEDGRVNIEGPGGGIYFLFKEGSEVRVSGSLSKRYSSFVKDLRVTGRWVKRDEGLWEHTGTDASINIYKEETGFWNVDFEGFKPDVEPPRYGFTEREHAEELVEKVLRQNSEGL